MDTTLSILLGGRGKDSSDKCKDILAAAKSAGQAQDAAFDRADGLLNNGLDKLMLKFEDTNPDFFRDYLNARIIIDLPGGHNHAAPPPTPPKP